MRKMTLIIQNSWWDGNHQIHKEDILRTTRLRRRADKLAKKMERSSNERAT